MACTLLIAWLISASGWAASGDVQPWDGFDELRIIAGEVGVSLRFESTLRWNDLKPHDIVVVIAPKTGLLAPDRRRLARFVEAGGRIVLADDFGPGASWLEAFGVSWRGKAGDSARSLHGLPQFPIYPGTSLGKRLGFQVPEVVLNRPASFVLGADVERDVTVAVHEQRDDEVLWLALLSHGAGQALVVADSSVMINEMTGRIHGNRQFVANTFRYFCSDQAKCSLRIFIGVNTLSGGLPPWVDNQSTGGLLGTFRRSLDRLFSGVGARWWVVALVILLLGIWTTHEPSTVIIPEREQVELEPPEHTVQAHLRVGKEDFTRPALHLAAHLSAVMKRSSEAGL
ncbi:MAG TPA: hypothetical protein DCQ06_00055 [Myxococcales bacterium]|nr:hypothetical protein [Myxococcales bacterium]